VRRGVGGLHDFVTPMSLVTRRNPGTLQRALAEGAHSPQRSRGRVATIAIAAVVVVAAVVGGILLFGGDGSTTTTGGPSGGGTTVDPTTPELTFKVTKAVAIPVTPAQKPKTLAGAAADAADGAITAIDAIYTEGFLDPSSWQGGDYGDAWSQFTDDAATKAEADADVLTAGAAAGDAYTTIEPVKATLRPRVLVDDKGKPVSVVAVVFFSARGTHADGSSTLVKSTGQFFLRPDGSDWRVVAFDVHRADAEQEATASPSDASASAEPTGSAS
jgi:hypothetical protein